LHKRIVYIALLGLSFSGYCQNKSYPNYRYSPIHLGVVPGLGTHRIEPDNYYNGISLNLFSGYSAGNRILEVGGVSNFNKYSSTGIQIAGLSNIIGGDRRETKQYKTKEIQELSADFQGIQLAGLQNIVTGDFKGIQLSGGINNNAGIFYGFQAAGLINKTGGYFYGLQISGLANFVVKYGSGFQFAGLLNVTGGSLHGIQIAPFNFAKELYGPKSLSDLSHGLQVGLFNKTGNMDGYQIGLVNKSDDSKGLQIGLVNIMHRSDGHPIALLNYGSGVQVGMRVWINDYLISNVGFSTGNHKLQNILYYGRNYFAKNGINWVIGYGLERNVFINNGDAIISYQLHSAWVNPTKKFNKSLSLILTPMISMSKHLGHKIYLYAGVGVNGWLKKKTVEKEESTDPTWATLYKWNTDNHRFWLWPAITVGIRTN